MKISEDDLLILPDEELKAQYKHDRNMQHLISLPMIGYICLFILFASDMLGSSAERGLVGYSAAAGFICHSFVLIDEPKLHSRLAVAGSIAQLFLVVLGIFSKNEGTVLLQILMTLMSISANLLVLRFIKEITMLKEHPRFPFDNWRRDESTLNGIYSNGSYEDRALRQINATLNKGKVVSGGHEDVFEGEPKKFEPPKYDPENNLQQRASIYRNRDKADTAYTMDNLKKMYFDDGIENGELSGKELEDRLWAETRPKKPKEPDPEDFLQTQPIIWRNK